jgi:hypothetical protein
MGSFISDVAGALSLSFAKTLRNSIKDPQFSRGELLAMATVMEIAGVSSSESRVERTSSETKPTWESLEADAKHDLDMVQRARAATSRSN